MKTEAFDYTAAYRYALSRGLQPDLAHDAAVEAYLLAMHSHRIAVRFAVGKVLRSSQRFQQAEETAEASVVCPVDALRLPDDLTEIESNLCAMLSEGMTKVECASALGMEPYQVSRIVATIREKMEAAC